MRKVISLEFDCEKCIRYLKLYSGTREVKTRSPGSSMWFLSAVFMSYLYLACLILFLGLHLLLAEFECSRFLTSGSLRLCKFCTQGVSILSAGISYVVRRLTQPQILNTRGVPVQKGRHAERRGDSFSL